jgi:hypothetical protein
VLFGKLSKGGSVTIGVDADEVLTFKYSTSKPKKSKATAGDVELVD